jgi:hyaluronoglucosaminidase
MRWWEPYPPGVLDQFAETIHVARAAGVTFCYAISFGVPIDYSSEGDFDIVTEKLRAFYDRGCRSFGVLVDDITEGFVHEVNRRSYNDVADAHADICNRIHDWTHTLDEPCSLYLCPTEYYGLRPFSSYLHNLGATLHPEIEVFYTGPSISSRTITIEHVNGFAEAVQRVPVIWDNYPVNDLLARSQMHVGPLRARDPGLADVTKGFVSNVMTQEEASKIALYTIAEYERRPQQYDPERAWRRALLRVAGHASFEPLMRFAENSLASPLQAEQAPEMTRLCNDALASLHRGEPATDSAAVTALSRYLDVLDESCYFLKNRMPNLRLRDDLLPWIEALEARFWTARRAIMTLKAIETGMDFRPWSKVMDELITEVDRNPKSIGGTAMIDLAMYARERAREAAVPDVRRMAGPPITAAELDSGPEGLHVSAAHGTLPGTPVE